MSGHESEDASSGVQQLIDRLRAEGVAAGRTEGERLVAEAREQARRIVEQARRDADATRSTARSEADALRRAAEDAVRLAARDALLSLRAELSDRFVERLQHLVAARLHEPDLLDALVLAVAGRARDATREHELALLLPSEPATDEAIRRDPDGLAQDALSDLTRRLSAELLRDGVTLSTGTHQAGLVLRLAEDGIELDLTDQAVAGLLLRHLHPRFRALLDGVVR